MPEDETSRDHNTLVVILVYTFMKLVPETL